MKPNYQPERTSSATNEIQNLFQRKSLLERLAPVMSEFLLSLAGGAERNRAAKLLPNYCYNIFKALRKTYCKSLPDLERLAQVGPKGTDWEAWGKLIGIGLRCLTFRESNLNAIACAEGLSMEDAAQLSAMICTMPWLTEKSDPWSKGTELVWETFLASNKSAHQCGLDVFTKFGGAIDKGMIGFIDTDGQCVGETSRANIYWFLLLVWPEIQEMQQRRPAITRADFHQWLQPFAQRGLVSITDVDQLLDVCERISLTFKSAGAPRKK